MGLLNQVYEHSMNTLISLNYNFNFVIKSNFGTKKFQSNSLRNHKYKSRSHEEKIKSNLLSCKFHLSDLARRSQFLVLLIPSVEEMSGHILDVDGDVHADDGLVLIGTRDVVVRKDPLAGSQKVFKLENPGNRSLKLYWITKDKCQV